MLVVEKKTLKKQDPYYATRSAIWDTFKWHFYFSAFWCYIGECCSIGYNSMLILVIGYITDDDIEVKWGVLYVAIFAALMMMSAYFRNRFIFEGYNTSLHLRKTITIALYNKIERLTVKSLTETDSGKVISIISGDLAAIARPLCFSTIILAAPFVNLTAYIVLAFTSGIEYALITFAWWILLLILQH